MYRIDRMIECGWRGNGMIRITRREAAVPMMTELKLDDNDTVEPAPICVGRNFAPPPGILRLNLAGLGIDHRAPDFPDKFCAFCEQNDLYEMEVSADGELIILPMVGARESRYQLTLNYFLGKWHMAHGGIGLSQSARFQLPSKEIRGADATWMTREHFDTLSPEQKESIAEITPDFVAEIRFQRDSLRRLQDKMRNWMAAGARLGWLIDTRNRRVYVYRAGQPEPELLDDPEALHGEDVLPGFVFPVRQYIFDLAGPEE